MDFKEYYHKKINEELDAGSEAAESYSTQAMGSNVQSLVAQYAGRGEDLKEGFKTLAADIIAAIADYAKTQLVNDDMFSSVDSHSKFDTFVDQKISLNAGATLTDLLRHIAVDIVNAKTTFTA